MSDLSGLELRRAACEVLGWRTGDRFWHHPWCVEDSGCVAACGIGKNNIAGLPAIESDPAISEPLFLEWCERNDWRFELFGPIKHPQKPRLDGLFGCRLAKWTNEYYDPRIEVYGSAPSEARARAIVKAGVK